MILRLSKGKMAKNIKKGKGKKKNKKKKKENSQGKAVINILHCFILQETGSTNRRLKMHSNHQRF